jgi:hypothetical protein
VPEFAGSDSKYLASKSLLRNTSKCQPHLPRWLCSARDQKLCHQQGTPGEAKSLGVCKLLCLQILHYAVHSMCETFFTILIVSCQLPL